MVADASGAVAAPDDDLRFRGAEGEGHLFGTDERDAYIAYLSNERTHGRRVRQEANVTREGGFALRLFEVGARDPSLAVSHER